MKITASFEDGSLSMLLLPETEAEQRMIGAVINLPEYDQGTNAYMDKSLISACLHYEGHFTNQRVKSLRLNVYRPNKPEAA